MKLLREATDEEAIQFYTDAIDTYIINGNFEKANFYKTKLEKDYNVKYQEKLTWKNANPALYYNIEDFLSFKDYSIYCEQRYAFRVKNEGLLSKDNPVKGSSRKLTQEDFDLLQETLGVECIYTPRRSGTEAAYVNGKDEIFMIESDEYCDVAWVIIHELGHIYDNRYIRSKFGIAGDMAWASSSYGTSNGGECFAEHFMSYFTNPSFLKNGWPIVYDHLSKIISNDFKKVIKSLLGA